MMNAIDRRLGGLLVLAAASLWASPNSGHAAPPNQALLGLSLAQAQNTDFFVFFHLNETSRERDLSKRVVVNFKPGSPAFRKVVTVRATLDAQGGIVQMELLLARSFVEERTYAGDIAKSLLVDAVPAPDRAAITPLATEIRRDDGKSDRESSGYEAYLGKRKVYSQEFSRSAVSIENLTREGEAWVRLHVSLRP